MMEDWRDTFMDQRNPHALGKIWPNVVDISNQLRPDEEMADIGCCRGHMYGALNHHGYTGFDFSADNIKAAKAEVGNLFEMTGSWDFVLCCRVLMHLPNFEIAIERLKAMAKRKLVVVIPIGTPKLSIEAAGAGKKTYFQTFSEQRVLDTGGTIIKHPKYSTVIYDR